MKPKCPDWFSEAVFYQIYPQSFFDSNGDGIGDISGVIKKLDYIKFLGCNAIWLNPCFESPFNDGGYDITDYYKVAKRYGTNSDLKRLFKEAKRLDIKVCLDIVAGHTSIEHPWFKESCKAKKNKYSNWYIWSDNVWEQTGSEHKFITGYGERNGSFMANFFWGQPALNYGFGKQEKNKPWQLAVHDPNLQPVCNELTNIMRFWLDAGASALRIDMAFSIIKNDQDYKETTRFWQKVLTPIKKDYPDAALISEWYYPLKAIQGGFHSDFMAMPPYAALFRNERGRDVFPATNGHSFFNKTGQGDITEFLDRYIEHYNKTKGKGYISIPTGTHDFPRISFQRTKEEILLTFVFLLTMPGVPFIYYGDEIGMRYIENIPSKEGGFNRTGSRTPMQWSSGKNAGFSNGHSSKLYLRLDNQKNRQNVEEQQAHSNSLLNKVRYLITLRKQFSALGADGKFKVIYGKKRKYPFVYMRMSGSEKFIIALNPSKYHVNADFKIPEGNWSAELVAGSKTTALISKRSFKVVMGSVSYGIFRILLAREN